MKRSNLRLSVCSFVLLLATVPVSIFAQQAQAVKLTLKDALTHTLNHKSEALKARLDEESSVYKIDEVKSRALPQLNGSGNINYNPILQLSAVPGELAGQPGTTLLIPFGQKWSSSAAISLSQTIFDQSVFTGLKAAKTTREYFQLLSQATDEQLIEQVASSYYQVLVSKQKLEVIDSTLATTKRVKDVIEGQYNNGLARKIDLDRTRVNISNLEAQRRQIINQIQLQENTLKFLMGMDQTTAIEIPAEVMNDIHPQLSVAPELPDVKNLSGYQLLKKQETLLGLQKEAAKAEYYPSLSLSGNYGYQGLGNKFPLTNGKSSGVNWFDYASVGLSLRIPIFNGFATRSRIRQADVEIRKVQEDLKNTEQSLQLGFYNAQTQLTNSIITLNNQKENVALAEEVFANTRNNYNQGLAPLTDLLDAENSLTTAQNNYSSALLEYRLAEIQLIKAQGKLKSLLN